MFSEVSEVYAGNKQDHFYLPVTLKGKNKEAEVKALVDSGASSLFISERFVKDKQVQTKQLRRALPVRNIDGTYNKAGSIKSYAELGLKIGDHEENVAFLISDLGSDDIIIGIDWLRYHNPEIDWNAGKVNLNRCPIKCDEVKAKRKKKAKTKTKVEILPKLLPTEEDDDEDLDLIEPENITVEDSTSINKAKIIEIEDEDSPRNLWIRYKASVASELAIAEEAKKEVKTVEQMVPKWLHDYIGVFQEEDSKRIPERKKWDHAIDFKDPNDLPPIAKAYPLSPGEHEACEKWLKQEYALGRLRDSQSPIASPFFFVAKKDGKLRPVMDYRKLNDKTIRNAYPLPRSQDLIDKLAGASLFSKMDVRWGYNNIRMKEGDEWKAAFKTPFGHHEPIVMYFGLTNSPATFQTMMNEIFQDLREGKTVVVYIDDILVFTNGDHEKHRKIVREVLQRLQDNDLYLKPEKCSFEKEEVEFLGLIVKNGCVSMDPVKVQGVKDWPTPTCVKDIQRFMGFANFYRRFILGFSNIAKPMNDLIRKDVQWEWTDK